MKNNILKYFTRPLSFILIALIFMFPILTVSAHADEPTAENDPRIFYMAEDESAIYDDNDTYTAHVLPAGYTVCDEVAYVYSTPIDAYDPYGNVSVLTPYVGSDVYWLDGVFYSDVVYMSDEAFEKARSFFNGTYTSFALRDERDRRAAATAEDRNTLSTSGDTRTVDVRDLAELERYKLCGFDSTGALSHTVGALYVMDKGTVLYVDYTALSNNYFDSDGEFSYRSGTVTATALNATGVSLFSHLVDDLEYPGYDYTYEDGGFDDYNANGVSIVLFWILVVFIGIILPILPIAFGIAYPAFSEKKRVRDAEILIKKCDTPPADTENIASEPTAAEIKKKSRRPFTPWYVVSICGALWMALGIAMLLILII